MRTELDLNERFCRSNEAVASSQATADRSSESLPSSSNAVHPPTNLSMPTPADDTTITHTDSSPAYNNHASPDGTGGGAFAARVVGSCNQSDSMQLQPRQPRPTPGNDAKLPTRHVRFDESTERQPQLLRQPSQASSSTTTSQPTDQSSQQRCQQPTLRPGNSAERTGFVPDASVPRGRTVQSDEDNHDGNERNGHSGNQLADPVAPALAGVNVMVEAVAPPSAPEAESSRRPRADVNQYSNLALSGSKRSGFGPVLTIGEPFHVVSQPDPGR